MILSWLAKQLLDRVMARLRAGDIRLALALYANDVQMTFPGDNSWSGVYRGKKELKAWLERFARVGIQIYPDEVISGGAAVEHQGLHPGARLRDLARGTDRLREPLRDLGQAEVGPNPGRGDLRGHAEAQGTRRLARAEPAAPSAGVVMRAVELSAGTVEYIDEGDGPPVVLLHGLA